MSKLKGSVDERVATLKNALIDAKLQIIHMHDMFGETDSGNRILARIDIALAQPRDPLTEETQADLREHALEQAEEMRVGCDDGCES